MNFKKNCKIIYE